MTVFTLNLFTTTSGLKCIHFNFLHVNVYIFITAVCSLQDWIISQYSRTTPWLIRQLQWYSCWIWNTTTILDPFLNQSSKETFNEYLRFSTKVFANNVYQDSDNAFKSLNNLRNNSNIIILSADKETCTVILYRTDYIKKTHWLMMVYLKVNKYAETADNTYRDLKHFQDFPYRHFCKTKYYDKFRPIFNQTTHFFAKNLIRLKRLIFKTSKLDQ